MTENAQFERGLKARRAVLGADYVAHEVLKSEGAI